MKRTSKFYLNLAPWITCTVIYNGDFLDASNALCTESGLLFRMLVLKPPSLDH